MDYFNSTSILFVKEIKLQKLFLDSECFNPPRQKTIHEPVDSKNEDIQLCVELEDKLSSESKFPASTESTDSTESKTRTSG